MTRTAIASTMPRYQSHKRVSALKIKEVIGTRVFFTDENYVSVACDPKMFSRYTPVPGDYYVVYDDGYESFSPAKPFEEGYTLIS